MPPSRIESLGVRLPERALTTEQVLAGCARALKFPLARLTGVSSRRVAGDGEFSFDLALKAARACLERSQYLPADVDLLIACSISHADGPGPSISYEPSTAVRLKASLGLPSTAIAFDLNNACAGMFTGVYVADALLRAGRIRTALVVSGEYISHLTATAQRELTGTLDPRMACLTLGDAGAAVLLDRAFEAQSGFVDIDLHSLSQFSHLCIGKPSTESGGMIMHTDSLQITVVGLKPATAHSVELLAKHGWEPSSLRHVVMHQTSKTTLAEAAQALNATVGRRVCHEGNTVDNLAERGNTATTTHVVALADRIAQGKVQPGDRLAFSITGSGLTVGTALYTMDDLPARLARTAPPEKRPPASLPRSQSRPVTVRAVGATGEGYPGPLSTVDLACAAVDECLRGRTAPEDIDLLIFAGTYHSELIAEPAMATLIAGRLGLHAGPDGRGKRTLAFDVTDGGLGFFSACFVASELLGVGKAQRALVVAAEVEPNKQTRPDHLRGLAEVGTAVLLEPSSEGLGLFGFRWEHLPSGAELLRVDSTQRDGRTVLEVRRHPRFEELAVDALAAAIEGWMRAEGVDPPGLAWVVLPHLSQAARGALGERLGFSSAQLVVPEHQGQDPFTSGMGLALLLPRLRAASGRGLFVQLGAGLQVGCVGYRT